MKKTITYLYQKKSNGEKMPRTALYDYPMACIAEEAGIDIINVGDSISMVMLGYKDSLGAKLDVMIEHAKAVRKGAPTAFVMGDMPFGSYQASQSEAIRNASRYLIEADMDCVKIEGGLEIVPLIKKLTESSIPVIAHTGLTPQSINLIGGFKTQGRDAETAAKLLKTVLAFEEAGAIAVVVESIPQQLAKIIYNRLTVPFLGSGAGPWSDSPMINLYDMLGYFDRVPRFAKKYANIKDVAIDATKQFCEDVKNKTYPDQTHCYNMADEELDKLEKLIN